MSKFSYIKKMIEQNKKSIINRTAAGLISLGLLTGALAGCDNITKPNQTEHTNQNTDNVSEIVGSDTVAGSNTTKPTTPNKPYTPKYEPLEHSDTWYKAKQRWGRMWEQNVLYWQHDIRFLKSPAPFKFLEEQGAVYYDENDALRPNIIDESFLGSNYIQSQGFIDDNTPENDFYLLVQFINSHTEKSYGNGSDVYIASYMLKYTLPDDCYRDLLLLNGDDRCNLLIQQIDEDYPREVVSKSVVKYDLLYTLSAFDTSNGVNQTSVNKGLSSLANYVENVDYDKHTLTINYADKEDIGKIYSYTYNVKESPAWEQCLLGSQYVSPITKEYRDSVKDSELMSQYQTPVGPCLGNVKIGLSGWTLAPGEQHKNAAKLKYDFEPIMLNSEGSLEKVNKYLNGEIPFEQVNDLTRQYASANLTK